MDRQQNKIARQIERQYQLYFHSNISDDFQPQDYQEFKSTAQTVSANDYESLILEYLGKQNKFKKFIEYLKNSPSFQQILLSVELKPIYELPNRDLQLGKNTNLIYMLPLNPYIEWNLDSIIRQVGDAQGKLLRQLMMTCRTFEEFIQKIEDYFLDFCIRKLDVSELVFNVNMLALQSEIEDREVKQILRELTCPDFIRLYSHFYRQKSYFGYIISRLSLPLPVLFTSRSQKGKVQYFHPQILNTILLQNDYLLITSIGSNKMKSKGKTTFLKRFFLLKDKTLSYNKSSFHQGSVDFYTRVPHKIDGKDIIIADFHGDLKEGSKYRQLLRKCMAVSTIVLTHVNERQIDCKLFQNSSFLKELDAIEHSINKSSTKILIGRDCRVGQDQLFQRVGMFNLIRLPNLTDQQQDPTISLRIDRIYRYMQEQSQNNYNPILIQPSAFLSEHALEQHKKHQSEVQYIMSILLKKFQQNRDNFYQSIFPNLDNQLKKLYLRQKIIKHETYLKQEIEEQCRQMLKDYNQSKQILQKLQRSHQVPKSLLIEETVRLLQQQGKFKIIYLLADKLSTWREKQAEKYIEFIISKNAQYSNLNKSEGHLQEKQTLKNIIKDAQQNLQKYDISVDTIFSQLIASIKKTQSRIYNEQGNIIFKYYDEAYQNLNPINLIEGKTLSYGNPFLQNFIEELHKLKYQNKKVFVVSVIGAQSSAKSTILNYIFRCNFATSVGRCTKGVYLTIVQCEEKVIVVVDTQGLLSVAARDHTFDVQIACFVMLISDLVIINNKGEVNAVLRDLLGVCIYAIDQLNAIQMGAQYQANRVIFTIRDQVEYGGSKQTQMLSAIIRSLDQNARVNYRKYIDFSEKDIYPLQSAFVSNNQGAFCIQSASNSFGKSIVSLRARIIQMLKTPKNQSLIQFYHNAKIRWQSIQNCGENIFNFKSIYQIKSKQQIKLVLQKVKKEYCSQFLDKQKLIIQAYKPNEMLEKQIDIQQQLKTEYFKFKQELLRVFQSRCQEKVNEKEFIKDYEHQVQEFCTIMYRDSIQKFKKIIQQRRIQSQNQNFKSQIRQNIKSSYSNGKLDKDIIVQYEHLRRQLILSIEKEINVLQEKHGRIGLNQISLHITTKIDIFRQHYYNEMNIQYHSLAKLKEQYLQVQNYKTRKSNKLIDMHMIKDKKFNEANINAEDIQYLTILICQFLNECEQSINRSIKDDFQASIQKIQGVVLRIVHLINDQFHKLSKESSLVCNKYSIMLQHKGIIVARFLSSLPLKFEKNYFDLSKINLQKKLRRQDEQMKQLIEQLKTSYKIRGSNKEIGKVWIKKILDRQLDRFLTLHQQIIQKELNEICSIINPKNIIQMAFKSLNSSQIRSKERWLQCFKIVKNTNRCLKEYLYERPQFKDLNQKLYKVEKDLKEKMNLYLESKLKQEVQTIISSKLQSTIEVQNDGQLKGVQYYQAVFGIDLFAYKKDDIPPRLLDILLCILQTVRNLQVNNAEYEYFNQHLVNQLKDKIQKLKDHIKVFTTQAIEPNVVGCQVRCPGCGMKCYKPGDHVDGHALMKETHLMQCFSGKVYHENGVRSADMCFTADSIIDRQVFLPDKEQRVPLLTYIQQRYPQWYQHYLDKSSYNTKSRAKECNVIWANIQYVIIKYKFKQMIPDTSVRKYQYDPLEDQDILRLQLEEY